MSANKKYYWLKLRENFFDADEMIILESMQDGFLYSNILIKMYLKSLKTEGRLMMNERIPYNPQMIATITRHQVGTVEKALGIFSELGLIEVLDNKAIYISDIQTLIGEGSSEADRKKTYREKIKQEQFKLRGGQMSENRPPEIDIELDLEKEKDIYISDKTKIYLKCYSELIGEHRAIKKELDFGWADDLDNEDFEEMAREHIETNCNDLVKCNIEYFIRIIDRYR